MGIGTDLRAFVKILIFTEELSADITVSFSREDFPSVLEYPSLVVLRSLALSRGLSQRRSERVFTLPADVG